MPLFKSIPVPGGLLSVWHITESSAELLSFFNSEEIADPAFRNFTFEKRKCEWLAVRALLHQMIGSTFQITYTESGKPLISHPRYRHISISHSREYVAVYIHEHQHVGIDIESINRNYAPIRKKYLSESELIEVAESSLLQCIYWCAKEAIFKLVEEDGIDFRKQIQVMALDFQKDIFFARFFSNHQERNYQLQFTSFNDHCMVWVHNDLV